jgi:endonuclease III
MNKRQQRADEILQKLKELFPNPTCELEYNTDWQLLFAVILSAQSTDKQVNKVTNSFFINYYSLELVANAEIVDLEKELSSIGLFRSKAKNIKQSARILLNDFGGVVPKTVKEIQTLPGAGRKTANVVLSELFGIHEGIAVDTHVGRLAYKLGLSKYIDPIKIEQDLMKLFDQREWGRVSLSLVLYGRYHSKAREINHSGPLQDYFVRTGARPR